MFFQMSSFAKNVRILHAKTSRFILRQHARISDHLTVVFLDSLFGGYPAEVSLLTASMLAFFELAGTSFLAFWVWLLLKNFEG